MENQIVYGIQEYDIHANLNQLGLTDDVINNKILINVHQYLDSNYSGTQNTCYKDINDPSSGFVLPIAK